MKRLVAFLLTCIMFFMLFEGIYYGKNRTNRAIGADNGIWVKIYQGWNDINKYNRAYLAIDPVNPMNIFGTYYNTSGKWKGALSHDCGKHWTSSFSFKGDSYIAINPTDDKIIARSNDKSLYISKDRGKTWTRIKTFNNSICDLRYTPDGHRLYITTLKHFYYTSDNGATIRKITDPTSIGGYGHYGEVSESMKHRNIIYATRKYVYKSTDYGQTWQKVFAPSSPNTHIYQVHVDISNDNTVYAWGMVNGDHYEAFRSNDGGNTWKRISSHGQLNLMFDPVHSNTVYMNVWGSGIFRSDNQGDTWTNITKNLPSKFIVSAYVVPGHGEMLYAVRLVEDSSTKHHIEIFRCEIPLQVPGNFTATMDSNQIAHFSWKYPTSLDIDGFKLFYKSPGETVPTYWETIDKSKRSYQGRVYGQKGIYTFYLRAVRLCERKETSDTARYMKKAKITSLKTSSNSNAAAKVKLTWDKSSIDPNADYIAIWKSNPDCTSWPCFPITVKTINKGSSDFDNGYTFVDGLKFSKKYTIFINVCDEGNGRGTDTSTDSKDIFIPDIPQGFEAHSSGNKVSFFWQYSSASQPKIDKFELYMLKPQVKYLGYVSPSSRGASYTVTAKGKYAFTVAAAKGDSRVYAISDDAYVLSPPSKPELSMSSRHVLVKWDKTAIDPNANKVVVYRSADNIHYLQVGNGIGASTGLYLDTSAAKGHTWYYKLAVKREVANKAADISDPSPEAKIDFKSSAPPVNLEGSARSCAEVSLNWQDKSDNEEHFVIERKEAGGTYSEIATTDPDTTTYTDSNVEGGKIYYYRVKATNSVGDSAYTNEVSVTVPKCATKPNAPSNLFANAISKTEINLYWTDNSDNEAGFKIERKTAGGTYTAIATLSSDTTNYKDAGLTPGTTYYYRVKAFNGKGDSRYSNEAHATTERKEINTIIRLWPGNSYMTVNGVKKEIDPGRGTKPVIVPKWGRTVVPIRAIVEALGGTIEWNGTERKVTIKFNGNVIELWIDKPQARVNGKAKWIDENNHDVRPIIRNDRTMLPLRFVAESLGCKVDWDNDTRTITITYPE